VFGAALQQAQELADAAAVTGYATRALPLFYCFSQGIRAASAAMVGDHAWRVRGHGARVATSTPILQSTITPKPSSQGESRDALSTLHILVRAEPMREAMRLGAVWAACPDTPDLSDVEDAPRPLRLHLPPGGVPPQHLDAGRIELAIEGLEVKLSDSELEEKLAAFPSLRGAIPIDRVTPEATATPYQLTQGGQTVWQSDGPLIFVTARRWLESSPVVSWPLADGSEETYREAFETIAPVEIEGSADVRMAFPAIGGVDAPEFIALWWVLLLALSSLTRYEPAAWTSAIEPDGSRLAVPIEKVCDFAESFVPLVLLQLLTAAQ
jgi:hypothetical protein